MALASRAPHHELLWLLRLGLRRRRHAEKARTPSLLRGRAPEVRVRDVPGEQRHLLVLAQVVAPLLAIARGGPCLGGALPPERRPVPGIQQHAQAVILVLHDEVLEGVLKVVDRKVNLEKMREKIGSAQTTRGSKWPIPSSMGDHAPAGTRAPPRSCNRTPSACRWRLASS